MDVYLEIGKKKVFACALDWPGWARSGKDEASALQALLDYGERYAKVVSQVEGFRLPGDVSELRVVERLEGNATTDFGAPGMPPTADAQPVSESELERLEKVLDASWQAFLQAVREAGGKELRSGPRGGGRQLEKIKLHVLDAGIGYTRQVGWKFAEAQDPGEDRLDAALELTRQASLDALRAFARGELPKKGPRGGERWSPRYFARRSAWHLLDHAWEIEDRVV